MQNPGTEFNLDFDQFVRDGHKYYYPGLLIVCVIFGYHDKELKVLLGKHGRLDGWVFPGGLIKKTEPLGEAANRILHINTSLDKVFLEQFHAFNAQDDTGTNFWRSKLFSKEFVEKYGEDNWLIQPSVSLGYYALIDYSKAEIKADSDYDEFSWHPVTNLPTVIFDNKLMDRALTTLRNNMLIKPIGSNLLPEKFTLPEIHALYETILSKTLDRRNFPNKLLSLGVLKKLKEKRKIGQHRSPFLYKFDQEKFEEALKNGDLQVVR